MCFVDGDEDTTVVQDEKVFAAIRPRYYMEHLDQMAVTFYGIEDLTGLNASSMRDPDLSSNYLAGFNDVRASSPLWRLRRLRRLLPAPCRHMFQNSSHRK